MLFVSPPDEAARALAPMLDAYSSVLLVHGNGPQVGQNLIRQEEAVTKVPPLPLDVCVAETQGSMGYLLEKALSNELHRRGTDRDLLSVLTQIVWTPRTPPSATPPSPSAPSTRPTAPST